MKLPDNVRDGLEAERRGLEMRIKVVKKEDGDDSPRAGDYERRIKEVDALLKGKAKATAATKAETPEKK